jgi:thiamine biosynthesis lipoprotein
MKKAGNQNSEQIHHRNAFLMNTILDIVLWGIDQTLADTISASIIKKVKILELTLNRYDKNSETFRVNALAPTENARVSPALMSVIKRSIEAYHATNGFFNAFAGKTYTALKGDRETSSFHKHTQINPEKALVVDNANQTIHFKDKQISLDFGGIGKGMALDAVGEILDAHSIPHAFISFGGSSILTRGHHPHGKFWPFSFRNEHISEDTWQLHDDAASVSSSGGKTRSSRHICNPVNGKRSADPCTSAVLCKNATDAEVVSTALIAAPTNMQQRITEEYKFIKNPLQQIVRF